MEEQKQRRRRTGAKQAAAGAATADLKPAALLAMACPFCGEEARVKACRNGDFFWRCSCAARGFFPDRHFRALEQAKKIVFY